MRARLALGLSLIPCVAGCSFGKEIGRTTFTGEQQTRDVNVTLAAAGPVYFETTVDVRCSGNGEGPINEQLQYSVSVVHAGKVTKGTGCDALETVPFTGWGSTQSNNDVHLSRSRLAGCGAQLEAGASTLRVTLGPMHGTSSVTPTKLDLFVMR